ncbi:hypothetical protein [Mesorhizobium sp. B2-8-3]|uniref:hypothetical protein n=1 Tax=Mesorhizobium sp. B2-8-3 TaxID=2589905 RepID=UPI0011296412|nr:hypothetical protein [Mesorhizobium sp. B2-8-3]TPJ33692.1 hypothetical protein FJ418_13770 [Mesorhizobium sp. B2-8-3]
MERTAHTQAMIKCIEEQLSGKPDTEGCRYILRTLSRDQLNSVKDFILSFNEAYEDDEVVS